MRKRDSAMGSPCRKVYSTNRVSIVRCAETEAMKDVHFPLEAVYPNRARAETGRYQR